MFQIVLFLSLLAYRIIMTQISSDIIYLKVPIIDTAFYVCVGLVDQIVPSYILHTYLAQTPEIGQGLGRFLSCGARKQEQT